MYKVRLLVRETSLLGLPLTDLWGSEKRWAAHLVPLLLERGQRRSWIIWLNIWQKHLMCLWFPKVTSGMPTLYNIALGYANVVEILALCEIKSNAKYRKKKGAE